MSARPCSEIELSAEMKRFTFMKTPYEAGHG